MLNIYSYLPFNVKILKMKKLLFSALIMGLLFTSCNKDDDGGGKSCAQLLDEVNDEITDYTQNQSDENCRELRDAIEAYQNKGCEDAEQFDIILSALNC
jgi:hypothetical protein